MSAAVVPRPALEVAEVIRHYGDGCAPRRQEGSGTGPGLERHAA